MDQRHPQPLGHPRLLRRRPGGHVPRGPVHLRRRPPCRVSRIEPRPDPGGVPVARHCCVHHLGAGEYAAARGITLQRVSSRSRATSTCSACSVCPTRYETDTSRFGCTSMLRATRRRSSWQRSLNNPAAALPCTTCSSTEPMSRSMSARRDLRRRPGPYGGWDAIIGGARVAGASTALLLARAGLQVLVVDRARRGSDTLSTHALMRGGVLQLRRWGLVDRVAATGAPPVRRVTFHFGAESFRSR